MIELRPRQMRHIAFQSCQRQLIYIRGNPRGDRGILGRQGRREEQCAGQYTEEKRLHQAHSGFSWTLLSEEISEQTIRCGTHQIIYVNDTLATLHSEYDAMKAKFDYAN
jgi:hypothetical protein